jgi:CBS domain-containing protein
MQARDVMTSPVITATPETPIREIAALLLERKISGLPIVDNGRVVGVLSESDLLRRVETGTERRRPKWLEALIDANVQAADFSQSRGFLARDVMSRDVVAVESTAPLGEVARILEQHRIKRVPVIDGGQLVGIISRANLLRALMVYQPPTAADVQSDQAILSALKERLIHEPWLDPSHLNLVVTDGVVHLWGLVKSEEQRRALEVAANSVPGVREVQNHTNRDMFANSAG